MELSEIVEKMKSFIPIFGAMSLNKEDGTILEKVGEQSNAIGDIGAFLGSAGDVIFKKLQMGYPLISFFKVDGNNLVCISEKNKFLLFKVNGDVDTTKFYEEFKKIAETPKVEEEKVIENKPAVEEVSQKPYNPFENVSTQQEVNRLGEIERKLLFSKVLQLNYLVDEFSQGGDRKIWNNFIKENLSGVDILEKALDIKDKIELKDVVPVEINRDEIQRTTKVLIDGICKKAVEVYGASEAKKMVQNVIEKLSKR
ncbi:MAG: hypothetical protein XD76_1025 [candidate division TA06 bacterium 32_111]|uniref:Uncharacterized protein n=2 Tax=Bacteria candidate phyla TaxID=1783234 RepID=A0A101I1Y5_UNCT6|nr:MAG: hypothetical protein XD76_1025 [candidate division TA06 bacterium 32_111]KUK87301.1 MAG: hypothetical protein XE03_0909 [candidate division TA06 bacterium 34_109]HAF07565.1 hypothetical protein [candidate division WOR-3 bacterium]HCP16814.1 hypothetical protein [candidate division WOR-3 bacterium]